MIYMKEQLVIRMMKNHLFLILYFKLNYSIKEAFFNCHINQQC